MVITQRTMNYFLSIMYLVTSLSLHAARANAVAATINVGVTPVGIAISTDGTTAYVANNNNYGVSMGAHNADSVSVIDLTTNSLITTIYDASFNEPYSVTINPAGTLAYVTNSNSTTITIVNTTTNTVVGTIGGFDGPSGMAITPDGTKAYVNNYGSAAGVGSGNGTTISVINLAPATPTIVATLTLTPTTPARAPAALAMAPSGAYVYVINYVDGNVGTGTLSVIKTSTNSIVQNAVRGLSGPFAIAVTPDGNYAYISNFGSNNFTPAGTTVTVINLNTSTLIANINVGIQPAGIAVTPDGKHVYVSTYNSLYAAAGFTDLTMGQGTVAIIDTKTNTLLPTTIPVGQSPGAIAIPSTGDFVYVSNYTSNTVSVLGHSKHKVHSLT